MAFEVALTGSDQGSVLMKTHRLYIVISIVSLVAYGLLVASYAALASQSTALKPSGTARCSWGNFA